MWVWVRVRVRFLKIDLFKKFAYLAKLCIPTRTSVCLSALSKISVIPFWKKQYATSTAFRIRPLLYNPYRRRGNAAIGAFGLEILKILSSSTSGAIPAPCTARNLMNSIKRYMFLMPTNANRCSLWQIEYYENSITALNTVIINLLFLSENFATAKIGWGGSERGNFGGWRRRGMVGRVLIRNNSSSRFTFSKL